MTVLFTLSLAACSSNSGTRPIPSESVPNDLLPRNATAAAILTPTTPTAGPKVYFIDSSGALSAWHIERNSDDIKSLLPTLLETLSVGPSAAPTSAKLTTALPSRTTLRLLSLNENSATIAISSQPASTSDAILAYAQIVMTATSVTGVERVSITHDGNRVNVPLPDGRASSEPLSANDYRAFIRGLGKDPGQRTTSSTPTITPTTTPT